MPKLQGKVAVITGSNSGIGLATAQKFVAEGAHELATAALFLASDDSSFMTGFDFCVDGGLGQF